MRIIGGTKRGLQLHTPDGNHTRPTMDKARETLFNILLNNAMLRPYIIGGACADVFAGSGAVGLECVSRGAKSCVFYECHKNTVSVLKRNIAHFDTGTCTIHYDALHPHYADDPTPYDFVFMDAPYTDTSLSPTAIQAFIKANLIGDKTLVTVQLDTHTPPPEITGFHIYKDRKIGGGHIYFYLYQD